MAPHPLWFYAVAVLCSSVVAIPYILSQVSFTHPPLEIMMIALGLSRKSDYGGCVFLCTLKEGHPQD